MINGQTYYDILGLPKNGKYETGMYAGYPISIDGIERALDRIKNEYGWGSREVERVQKAYDVVSNSETRKKYDEYLANFADKGISFEEFLTGETLEQEETEKTVTGTSGTSEEIEEKETEEKETEEKETEEKEAEEKETEEKETEEKEAEEKETEEKETEEKETEEKEEEPVEETPTKGKEEKIENIIPIELASKSANKTTSFLSRHEKLRKSLVGAGIVLVGSATFGLPGLAIGLPVALITNKIISGVKKYKLKKENKIKNISDFKTEETKLFEKYNKDLEEQIKSLLSQKHSNYELEIAILKYKNQVKLLEARIENKKQQQVKRIGMLKYKIELKSLERQLKNAKITLALLEEKVKEHNRETRLTKLNDKLYKKRDEFDSLNAEIDKKHENNVKVNTADRISVKNLEIDYNILKRKRDKKAQKMVLHKKGISNRQAFLVAFGFVKKKISNFFESIKEDEKGGKSR